METLTKVYRYNGVDLPVPMQGMSDEQVKNFYSDIYPELLNAEISGGTKEGDLWVVEFKRAVGTKG